MRLLVLLQDHENNHGKEGGNQKELQLGIVF